MSKKVYQYQIDFQKTPACSVDGLNVSTFEAFDLNDKDYIKRYILLFYNVNVFSIIDVRKLSEIEF